MPWNPMRPARRGKSGGRRRISSLPDSKWGRTGAGQSGKDAYFGGRRAAMAQRARNLAVLRGNAPRRRRPGLRRSRLIAFGLVGLLGVGLFALSPPGGFSLGQLSFGQPSLGQLSSGPVAETVEGTVTHVRDGDTIEVDGRPIRLNGLHAPELDDPFGRNAAAMMRGLVDGRTVLCELTGERSYDRWIGRCYLDGQDIAIPLLEAGLARDCPAYSNGRYAPYEIATTLPLPGYC